ncbi:uncharacterized protein FA14DRAFT_17098 [Meira miltonrushii]|uniref:Uncharacterized protein n=1 Tax=Meira miltonrushii TaxID=1280837 RepID=A0A316VJ32_9BASI|nr:uncharacterized protein FA14DRAFT_17098 [Meira miltonrushii]PWN37649.1 hypothetical protein FA14DRAFT_17098 [Meira miltonrushii]
MNISFFICLFIVILSSFAQSLPDREDSLPAQTNQQSSSNALQKRSRGTKRKTRSPPRSPSPPNFKPSCEEIVCWENSDCANNRYGVSCGTCNSNSLLSRCNAA